MAEQEASLKVTGKTTIEIKLHGTSMTVTAPGLKLNLSGDGTIAVTVEPASKRAGIRLGSEPGGTGAVAAYRRNEG